MAYSEKNFLGNHIIGKAFYSLSFLENSTEYFKKVEANQITEEEKFNAHTPVRIADFIEQDNNVVIIELE